MELITFLRNDSAFNLAADFQKISPDNLSAIYEIGFSAANVQAANLDNRFTEIRNGSTGFTSSLNISNDPGNIVGSKDGKALLEPKSDVLIPSPENKWGVWASGSGDFVNVSGDGNGTGYDFTTGGVNFGLDYRLSKNLAVGIAAGYAHTSTSLVGDGSIDVNSGRAAVYATFYRSGFYLNGYLGGGYSSYNTRRAALNGNAVGNTDGWEFNAYVGGGYEFHYGGWTFGPIGIVAVHRRGLQHFQRRRLTCSVKDRLEERRLLAHQCRSKCRVPLELHEGPGDADDEQPGSTSICTVPYRSMHNSPQGQAASSRCTDLPSVRTMR